MTQAAATEFKEQPKFFPGAKRKLVLDGWTPLMNGQDEKLVRLDYAMPLTGEDFAGMPGFIGSAFESMNLEGITCEFFATDKSPRRHLLLAASTLRNFCLERNGEGIVVLHFSTTVRRDEDLVVWAHKYEGATMYGAFEATQPVLKAPPADDKQMTLADQPKNTCGYQEKGKEELGKCVLTAGHKGAHDIQAKAKTEASKEAKPKSRSEKEAEAKASGKPRGFVH